MNVYVAGSSRELDRAEAAMDVVRSIDGLYLSSDWVQSIRDAGSANRGLSTSNRYFAADSCRSAVCGCHILWLLLPEEPTIGAWVELGIFSGLNRDSDSDIITSGLDPERSIFTALAIKHFPDDAKVAKWLEKRAE